jgi:hypothetical protein
MSKVPVIGFIFVVAALIASAAKNVWHYCANKNCKSGILVKKKGDFCGHCE